MRLIGKSRSAAIYFTQGKAFKIFTRGTGPAAAKEAEIAGLIDRQLPCAPRFYGIKDIQGQTRLVYEYIPG